MRRLNNRTCKTARAKNPRLLTGIFVISPLTHYKSGSNIPSMRRNLKDETRIRAAVEDKIIMTSAVSAYANALVYIPPSYLAEILNSEGTPVTREYIYRRYAEHSIRFDTTLGLWCKRTK